LQTSKLIWETLVKSWKLTYAELDRVLELQANVEKKTWIKARIADLVFKDDYDEKIKFLEENNIKLMIGEKLYKAWLINADQLFEALAIQNWKLKVWKKVNFWDIILEITNNDPVIKDFLNKE
jgi:hypothetical protein